MTQWGGKTYIARRLAAPLPSVVGYDVKGDLDIPNAKIVGSLDKVYGEPRVVLRPERYRAEEFEQLCAYLMVRKHTTLIDNDAALHFVERGVGQIGPRFFDLIILGQDERRFGVGYWGLTQRLNNFLHNAIIANAWDWIVFRLPHPEDRVKLAGVMGPGAEQAGQLDRHYFLFYRMGMPGPVVCEPVGGPLRVRGASKIGENVRDFRNFGGSPPAGPQETEPLTG